MDTAPVSCYFRMDVCTQLSRLTFLSRILLYILWMRSVPQLSLCVQMLGSSITPGCSTHPRFISAVTCGLPQEGHDCQSTACAERPRHQEQLGVPRVVDEAEGGRTADRPEFNRMIDEARSPKAAFRETLVWKLSRRSPASPVSASTPSPSSPCSAEGVSGWSPLPSTPTTAQRASSWRL